MDFSVKTDLAVENREIYLKAKKVDEEIPGVTIETDQTNPHFKLVKVKITSEEGEKAIGKPCGTYITLESPFLNDQIEERDEEIVQKLTEIIQEVAQMQKEDTVLVVGLGNESVTPDALGPKVIEQLQITRHLLCYAPEYLPKGTRSVSAIIPGVLGTTGIETLEILQGIVEKTSPQLVIVIDALASKDMNRVNQTVQISNTGIIPGSGVGNSRFAINKETLGVNVIVLGVPTVVGVPTIVEEAISCVLSHQSISEEEKEQKHASYMKEILENKKFDFMVTTKDIDDIILHLSDILSQSLNRAFL